MTDHIVALRDCEEYVPETPENTPIRSFRLSGGGENTIGNNIAVNMKHWSLLPSPVALDLLDTCIAVYTADKIIARSKNSWDGWTRDVDLHVAVRQLDLWQGKSGKALVDLVQFLTGDKWSLEFRQYSGLDTLPKSNVQLTADEISLFSGGADSFVGAIDELRAGKNVLLISHHGRGQAGAAAPSQRDTLAVIRSQFPTVHAISYFVAAPLKNAPEDSSRSRALLFYALAAVTALAVGAKRILIPENGHVSLNIPLTPAHLGSASTRSTHPNTVYLWRQLLAVLGIELSTDLPYHQMTKGEVLQQCQDANLLQQGLFQTVSCGNPNVATRDGSLPVNLRKPGIHCGYCWACLVRRSAIQSAFGLDNTPYAYSDLRILTGNKAQSVQAARYALRKDKTQLGMSRILSAGPLPLSPNEINQFFGVYKRGQAEVQQLLSTYNL